MPEGLLTRRLSLGTYAGIPLFVHWSFALSVLLVSLFARESGVAGIAFSISQLLGVFLCITLHEYGHALAARKFGIRTVDITLLPIGGVARLSKIPRVPWQELLIAIAGPAVNVVIVGILVLVLLGTMDPGISESIRTYFEDLPLPDALNATASAIDQIVSDASWLSYLVLLLLVNVVLILFNMIPAFPMDGGRVFRSLMAMVMDYRRATSIASKLGLFCAAMMAFTALRSETIGFGPLLVACFIAYAGISEARQVNVMETVRELTVTEVMVRGSHHCLLIDTPAIQVAKQWKNAAFSSLPIVTAQGVVVGVLALDDVVRQLKAGLDPSTSAGTMVNRKHPGDIVQADERVENILGKTDKRHRQLPVVDSSGHLLGLLDLDTVISRSNLARHASAAIDGDVIDQGDHSDATSPARHFDAIT